jgi:hypothetical protein
MNWLLSSDRTVHGSSRGATDEWCDILGGRRIRLACRSRSRSCVCLVIMVCSSLPTQAWAPACREQMFTPVYTPVSRKPTGWMSFKSMLLPVSAPRPEEVRLILETPSRTKATSKSLYGLQLVRRCVRWVRVVAGLQNGGRGALDTWYKGIGRDDISDLTPKL